MPTDLIANAPNNAAITERFRPPELPRRSILGIPFHALTLEAAVARVESLISEQTPRQVFLGNAYTVSMAKKNPRLCQALDDADLVLADGMSIVWGAKWLGIHLPERIAGPDLMEALCAQAAERGYRIFLMGGSQESLEQLRTVLLSRWPALIIAGACSPSYCDQLTEEESLHILQLINQSRPDILMVSMSAPKQELWISKNLPRLHVPISIGFGAAFDFLSGRIPRAPEFMRRLGLEWLFRLAKEPKRLWRRYLLGNGIYLSHLTLAVLKSLGRRTVSM